MQSLGTAQARSSCVASTSGSHSVALLLINRVPAPRRALHVSRPVVRRLHVVNSHGGSQGGQGNRLSLANTSSGPGGALQVAPDEHVVNVKFVLKYATRWGQSVKIIGSHPQLGNWSLSKALELRWSEGDQWFVVVQLPAPSVVEYKYVVVDFETKQPMAWQTGSNAILALEPEDVEVDVFDNWGNAPGSEVRSDGECDTREAKLQKWAGNMMSAWKEWRKADTELMLAKNDNNMLRSEAARLRMELSLTKQSEQEAVARLSELEMENARLTAQLVDAQRSMNNTLQEALQLLAIEEALSDGLGPEMEEGMHEDELADRSHLNDSQQHAGAGASHINW